MSEELPTVIVDNVDAAIAAARAPRVPASHLRGGLVSKPEPVERCEWRGPRGCNAVATEIIRTRTVRKPLCSRHGAIVRQDVERRVRRTLPPDLFH